MRGTTTRCRCSRSSTRHLASITGCPALSRAQYSRRWRSSASRALRRSPRRPATRGALYVFTTYAIDVGFGPGKFATFTTGTGAASWEGVARALYGLFWVLVFFAIVNSTLANSNAGVNVSSRTSFAMGRIGAFPSILASVSPRHRSPVVAIALGGVISLVVMLALGLHYDPTTAFAMVGTGLVIMIVGVYILMNLSCIGYFARSGRLNVVSHVVAPVLGIAAFVPAWCAGSGIKIPGFSFITPLPAPLSYMGPAVAIW